MREMTDLSEIIRIARSSYPYPIARNLHAIGNTLSLRERYHEIVHEAPENIVSRPYVYLRSNGKRDGDPRWPGK